MEERRVTIECLIKFPCGQVQSERVLQMMYLEKSLSQVAEMLSFLVYQPRVSTISVILERVQYILLIIDPVIICAVVSANGDKLLLGRQVCPTLI